MFLGTHTPRLDDKGRLTLPAKYRDELAGGLMITKGQDHCLYVFPRAEFEQMARKVAEAPFTNEAVRAYQRYLFAGTDEQRPDGQGRVSIAPELRRYAGLTKECVVIGAIRSSGACSDEGTNPARPDPRYHPAWPPDSSNDPLSPTM